MRAVGYGSDLGPVAVELAAMPGVRRRLLEVHVPDRLGRCAGCTTSGGSGVRWPCTLHAAAAEAERRSAPDEGQARGA